MAKPIPQRWHGALEGRHKGLLYGWCLDTQVPDARVVLELCLNGEPLGSFTADVARSDLAPQFAKALPPRTPHDHCHGFVAELGEGTVDPGAVLTVRVANTECYLSAGLDGLKPLAPPVAATSKVLSDGGLRLLGWAMDARRASQALTIQAFEHGQILAKCLANERHPALVSYEVGSHGFSLDLPLNLADGRAHTVHIADENGSPLNGSPVTVCCHLDGAKTLLPQHSQGLLAAVIDNYERHLPRSVGLQHYAQWSAAHETPDPAQSPAPTAAKIGIIVTGQSTPAATQRTLDSLQQQTGVTVQVFAASPRAKTVQPFANLLQRALTAKCDFIACVRSGDTLPGHALSHALQGFAVPNAELVYTDSELNGVPWLKPAWNPEYALATDYPLELMLVRSSLAQACAAQGPLPPDPASWAWRVLAALWPRAARAIVHVPRVLYQFNSSLDALEQQARWQAARLALQALEPASALTLGPAMPACELFAPRRLQRSLSKRDLQKTVSLIIPTRDRVELLRRCIATLQQFTAWEHLEIVVVDNDSVQPQTKAYLRQLIKKGVKVLHVPGAFNFAQLNNMAVAAASGEIVGLINNDIEALHSGWLDEMVSQLLSPGVGAVGAKLLWPNGMVQHGGVLLGVGNVAGHYGNRLHEADWGNHGRNQLVQQVSAVTAACLLMRKRDYLAAGGMDASAFPVAFNDVDLCLKLRAQGKTIVWTPYARLLHVESASRGHEDSPQKRSRSQRELDQLRQRWGAALLHDPAYHPSLNLDAHSHAFGGLAMPPRSRAPRLAGLVSEAK
jgi:GT2 family glycosyltransferase